MLSSSGAPALEQVAAAGDAHQAEYPVPKAPGVGVDACQRQALVHMRQGFVNDRTPGLDARDFVARQERQKYFIGAPFDAEFSDRCEFRKPVRRPFPHPAKTPSFRAALIETVARRHCRGFAREMNRNSWIAYFAYIHAS